MFVIYEIKFVLNTRNYHLFLVLRSKLFKKFPQFLYQTSCLMLKMTSWTIKSRKQKNLGLGFAILLIYYYHLNNFANSSIELALLLNTKIK